MFAYIAVGIFSGYRTIREVQPDVIHCHFAVPAGALGWMLSRLTGTPYLLTVHLGDVPGGVPEKTDRWFRWLFPFTPPIWKRARKVVAVSEYTCRLAEQYYPVSMEIIPNGVELDQLDLIPQQIHAPVQLLFAGRFMPQKNPIQSINILAQLIDLPWNCSMIGDGPLLNDVKKLSKDLGLFDRIKFTGWVTPEEVLDHLSKADILLMPSLSEGLPVIGVQALSKGLALVVSRVGGFIELVEEGKNGYLIEPADLTGFVSSLRELLTNSSKLSEFRRASLLKAWVYDLDKVVSRYEGVLLESQ
jgi:glycosyltransferase involved in cell wall biosynthesis